MVPSPMLRRPNRVNKVVNKAKLVQRHDEDGGWEIDQLLQMRDKLKDAGGNIDSSVY